MPSPDSEEKRAYHRRYMKEIWYPANREKHKKATRARNTRIEKETHAWITSIKVERGCVDCGIKDARVLDFDHVRGEKKFNIGGTRTRGFTRAKILEEIEKCEVRCCNCHRISHRERD